MTAQQRHKKYISEIIATKIDKKALSKALDSANMRQRRAVAGKRTPEQRQAEKDEIADYVKRNPPKVW